MRFLYTCSISLFGIGIRVYSLFNQKAALWIAGRKNWEKELRKNLKGHDGLIWLHCSSLGEFEQGRPIIEALEKKGQKVLLTFFSPSGYEHLKNYKYAAYVCYLPLDNERNAKKFLEIARPKAAIFVKYEFWYNYIQRLHQQNIPLFLISGIFRKEQHFFKTYGTWFAKQLKSFTYFFVQDDISKKLLNSIGIEKVSTSGDTRFDRVIDIASAPKDLPKVEEFSLGKQVLVAGSTWPEDEDLLIKYLDKNDDLRVIIAPHNVDLDHIQKLKEKLGNRCNVYSSSDFDPAKKVLLIDQIGLLSSIYRFGQLAYIGGGFGKGIHNTLEAAVYGVPLIFGPHFSKFKEAKDLIALKGAFSIQGEKEFSECMHALKQETARLKSAEICRNYVQQNKGATEIILNKFKDSALI